jgi:hypothetical protein
MENYTQQSEKLRGFMLIRGGQRAQMEELHGRIALAKGSRSRLNLRLLE